MKLMSICCAFLAAGIVTADEKDATKEKAVPHEMHTGYFVSNKVKVPADGLYQLTKTKDDFDKTFRVGFVMGDRANRLKPNSFDKRWVVSAIKKGTDLWTYTPKSVTVKGKVLTITYKAAPQNNGGTATFVSPMILSVDQGAYDSVVFMENGKKVSTVTLKK